MFMKPICPESQIVSILNRGETGIDKIKIFLNQSELNYQLLDSIQWHYDSYGKTKIHTLNLNQYLSIEKVGPYYLFIINQEFLFQSRLYNNILVQIYCALHCLALEGFILVQPSLDMYFANIHHITELEIYFSLKKHYFSIFDGRYFISREEAKDNQGLYRFNDTETFYSYNGFEASSVCLYNKKEKDLHDRCYSHDDINNFPYPYRLEFRLRGNDISNLCLLNAPYHTVFTNYLPTLAFLHNKFLKNNMDFNIPLRNKYQRVMRKSEEVTSIRNRI